MPGKMASVNAHRNGIRQQRARQTRRRMLAAAARLFASRGYVPTTMAAIAGEAAVAVQTVHFTFHTKAELLREVIRVVSAGEEDPRPVMEREWVREALTSQRAERTLALSVEHGTDIFRRIAPLRHAIETAASVDGEVAELWRSIAAARRAGIGRLLRTIHERGQLKTGMSPNDAIDIMSVVHSHEAFLSLVEASGWSVEKYKAWQYETLCDQLLGSSSGNADRRKAAVGLSFENLVSRPHETRTRSAQAGPVRSRRS